MLIISTFCNLYYLDLPTCEVIKTYFFQLKVHLNFVLKFQNSTACKIENNLLQLFIGEIFHKFYYL